MQEPISFGNYDLVRRLAVSSMSEVFLAFPRTGPRTRTPVVVKRLLEDVASIDTFVSLFHNEADIASSLNHPCMVRFMEFGQHEGMLFLVMEYVDGLDLWRLNRRLKRAGSRIGAPTVIYITSQVLSALGYLHDMRGEDGSRLNIVHHDVSPSNILIGHGSVVKLGDFGIAYSEQRELENLGRKFKGKVHYLSPEQVRGDAVDQRSDIYSACVVFVELILGKKLFEGPTDLSVLINVRDRHSPVLEEGLGRMPEKMAAIVEKGMAVDPQGRYQDAASFKDDLLGLLTAADVDAARMELDALLASVTSSVDGVKGLRSRVQESFNLAEALTRTLSEGEASQIRAQPLERIESRVDAQSTEERTPATPIKDASTYMVRRLAGEPLGAMPLSAIIEGIVCGRIQEEDLVSIDGAEFMRVASIAELTKHLPSVTPTARSHDLGLPDRRGIIQETPVVEVFLEMFQSREKGLLVFECSSIRKDVFIEEGTPRYISSNLASELLGEYLVRRGIISRMELDMALAVLDRFAGHLGDTLLGLDIVDSITLLRAITNQIKERLYDVYGWENGEFTLYRNATPIPSGFRLSVPALELIKEGCLESLAKKNMEAWFSENRRTGLVLAPSARVPLDEWKFSTSYGILLSSLETRRTLAELMKPYEHASEEVRGKLLSVLRFALTVGLLTRQE